MPMRQVGSSPNRGVGTATCLRSPSRCQICLQTKPRAHDVIGRGQADVILAAATSATTTSRRTAKPCRGLARSFPRRRQLPEREDRDSATRATLERSLADPSAPPARCQSWMRLSRLIGRDDQLPCPKRISGEHTAGPCAKCKYPPAEPEALRLLAPQRGLFATGHGARECRCTDASDARYDDPNGKKILPEMSNSYSHPGRAGVLRTE